MAVRRRRTKRPRQFEGPLAEPIRIRFHYSTLAGGSPEEAQRRNIEEHQRAFRELLSRVDLLFPRYGLDRKNRDWPALVVGMAMEFIPGFRIVSADKRKRGHPHSSSFEDICLLVDVELVKRDLGTDGPAVSDAQAAAALTERSPYKLRWGRLSVPTLRNKLSKARRSTNPLAEFWRLQGGVGQVARGGLIEMFGATRQNIFVSGNKR